MEKLQGGAWRMTVVSNGPYMRLFRVQKAGLSGSEPQVDLQVRGCAEIGRQGLSAVGLPGC
ncbi:hypothetical protein, partial [Paracoccus sp. (in: a-proteobacteria)]|uniref:hypothetical protein n=1 Tax=Paracoccus sp. TaxID=267 RepID=UPI0032426DD7